MILEDIATAPLTDAIETDRLAVLARIEALPVGMRTDLGRTLLGMLEDVVDAPPDSTMWRFRRLRSQPPVPYLMFGACTRFNEAVRWAFGEWVLLRHYEFGQILGQANELTSVGVLLTPRHEGLRPWDTTMVTVSGPLELSEDRLLAMRQLWNSR
jgi:hypothetical protein